ncbi:MAG: CPBP family intramembrane glutamic endopeptidase [Candidatus Thorarchaeota archaeon]
MLRKIISDHTLAAYVLLAYGITWIIALPLILSYHGLISISIPFSIHYLTPLGPILSALIVTGLQRGKDGLREIISRITKWRVRPVWIVFAVLFVWILYIVSGMIILSMGQVWPDLSIFGQVLYMPYLTFIGAWFLWIFSFGLGEETGWRGFLLPRLQSRYNAMISTLIVAIIWAGWHIPMFLYNENLIAMGFAGTIFWVIGLIFGATLLTWLYNSSEGSVLVTAIWHGTYNLFTGAQGQAAGLSAGIISMFVMIWVVIIVLVFRPRNLSRLERQTA